MLVFSACSGAEAFAYEQWLQKPPASLQMIWHSAQPPPQCLCLPRCVAIILLPVAARQIRVTVSCLLGDLLCKSFSQ